jgi:hypothetical protein
VNVRHVFESCMVAALMACGSNLGLDKASAAQAGPVGVGAGVEVLTRGPVHEAFAETITFNPEPGVVAPKAPPDIIEEVPPDQRPEGADVAWIPGYWAWDDERSNYLWVSGIWRALPPGRQWVPGYWGRSEHGVQWTSGYWADADVSEIEYLPEPPDTVEAGPNMASPSADQIWIPGCWVWHDGRYAWRPGYWATVQRDWDWVPAHYVWAPRGYVFVEGYWDYSVNRRGVLFAPVYFDAGVYGRPGFSYSPTTVIDLAVFTDHLFVRPNYGHYYFGDYYAAGYRNQGFYAPFSVESRRYGYDPIYAHQRWEHRQDRDWEHHVETDFQNRRDHEDARPPRTLAAQLTLSAHGTAPKVASFAVATSLDQLSKRKDSPMRFQPLPSAERQQLAQRGREIQTYRGERQKLETRMSGAPAANAPKAAEPARVKLPRSSIVGNSADRLGKGQAPPKRYEAPAPDPKVTPAPRRAGGAAEPPRGASEVKKGEPKGESKDKDKNDDKRKNK